jgi:FkbM family methyltransferase
MSPQIPFVRYGGPLDTIRVWLTSPLRRYATRQPSNFLKELIVHKLMPAILPRSSAGVVVTLPGGGRVKMDFSEEIARLLLLHGAYEASEIASVLSLAKPGSTAIDVGANVGMYTVALATRIGSAGKVLAFEPVPQTSHRLRENLALNGLENVEVFEAAAGQSRGFADLQLADDSAYASMAGVKQGRAIGQRLSVRVTPLDEVWNDRQRPVVSFCKIDVEGAEMSVLEGAKEMLAACRPALLLEADPGPELDALASWLRPRNYREQPSADFSPWNHLFVSEA